MIDYAKLYYCAVDITDGKILTAIEVELSAQGKINIPALNRSFEVCEYASAQTRALGYLYRYWVWWVPEKYIPERHIIATVHGRPQAPICTRKMHHESK